MTKIRVSILLSLMMIALVIIVIGDIRSNNVIRDQDVHGIVERIFIQEKAIPYFLISNDTVYFGDRSHALVDIIQIGDSVSKPKGGKTIEIFKLDTLGFPSPISIYLY